MGVPGLTTYISDNSRLYLKPHELCDCYLVVDGNSVAFNLLKWVSERHSAFGGDYDEYYKTVKDFFSMLKTCNVTSIVLFDGGYESRKINTTLARAKARLPLLRAFAKGFSTAKFYPLFIKQTFCDVMEDLGILCVQCELEADAEIAAIARTLNCPVLSYDSDFYIFDVLYIPFSTVYTNPVRFSDSNKYYVRCSIYDVRHFLNKFDGLDKSLLPVIGTLLGNDYINRAIFDRFIDHVSLPKRKNKSHTQRKIHGVLTWLQNENFESAVKKILSYLEYKNAKKVVEAINRSVQDYSHASASEAIVDILKTKVSDIRLNKIPSRLNFPPKINELYYNCRIHRFIIDMISLRTYFTPQQVEYIHGESTHCTCLQLIADIDNLLAPYAKNRSQPLKLYINLKNQYCPVILKDLPSTLKNITLLNILKEPEEIRLKWFCGILGVGGNDLEIVPKSDWSIFILSLVYWIKNLNRQISLAHIHALILMSIANGIIQRSVGFFKNHSRFIKVKGNLLAKLKSEPIAVGQGRGFEEMLNSVTLYEKLLVQGEVMPFRQSTEKGTGKAYCISTIHLFGSFQSCLYHIMQVNALLNYPLPHLKISDFYSGTLLFNFYLSVKAKTEVDKFGCNLFKNAPNLKAIYAYLQESLCEYSEKTDAVIEKESKRRKNRKKKSSKKPVEILEREVITGNEDEEDDEYDDKNNPFAVLQYGVK